jgi:hypothetical protein
LQLRVGWASTVGGAVLSLYSPYFRKRFLQQDALELAWKCATAGEVNRAECIDLLEQLEELKPDAEDENYGRHAVLPGMLLLTEILGSEQDSVPAVNNAALLFAAHHIYRRGIGSFDPVIPREYEAELEVVCHRYAREVFNSAKSRPEQPVERDMFSSIRLSAEIPSLDARLIDRATTKPPPHETEFIREQRWTSPPRP